MPANNTEIEKRLWDAADELRANSKLKSSEYSIPVLGLIFLRYADFKFSLAEQALAARPPSASRRRAVSKIDYQAQGVMYLPPEARWSQLMLLPESADIGKAVNDAMRRIEDENDDLFHCQVRVRTRAACSRILSGASRWSATPILSG